MDRDSTTVEQLFARASQSALKALDAVIDVEQRLRELHRDVGVGPDQRSADRTDQPDQ